MKITNMLSSQLAVMENLTNDLYHCSAITVPISVHSVILLNGIPDTRSIPLLSVLLIILKTVL